QRHTIGPAPLQFTAVGTKVWSNRQLHVVTNEPAQQSAHTATPGELTEDQTHDRLHLLVGIDHEVAGNRAHVTDRRVIEHFTSLRFVPHAFLKTTLKYVQLRFTHRCF